MTCTNAAQCSQRNHEHFSRRQVTRKLESCANIMGSQKPAQQQARREQLARWRNQCHASCTDFFSRRSFTVSPSSSRSTFSHGVLPLRLEADSDGLTNKSLSSFTYNTSSRSIFFFPRGFIVATQGKFRQPAHPTDQASVINCATANCLTAKCIIIKIASLHIAMPLSKILSGLPSSTFEYANARRARGGCELCTMGNLVHSFASKDHRPRLRADKVTEVFAGRRRHKTGGETHTDREHRRRTGWMEERGKMGEVRGS